MRALLAVLVVLTLGAATRADACSCQAPGPPCTQLFTSTVFVGTATGTVDTNGAATTRFDVTDVLHADTPLGKTVEVHHSSIGSACGLTFKKGTSYVVYAHGAEQLSAGACSRTHVFKQGDEDVAYAHAPVTRTTARIEGVVVLTDGSDGAPKSGVEVRVAGTTLTATTDARGKFTLLVPPGTHTLETSTPGLRVWQGHTVQVTVPVAAACATPMVQVAWDGRIEGTLTSNGKPVVGLEVFALAKNQSDRHWRISATTDAQGHYVIHEVPAGENYVGVSVPDFSGVDPQSPYPTTWYPGVPTVKAAKLVTLERAGLASHIDFALPPSRARHTISGIVRHKNGAPAVGVSVFIGPEAGNRGTGGSTDAKGAFSYVELEGEALVVRACEGKTCVEAKRVLKTDVMLELVLPN